ncbi:MAG: acyltransferase family protein [Chitinophagales bacterium]
MKKTRRYDIDWIRILVFDLLILFHVGMFFNTWGWHIKNDELVSWLNYPMSFISQWRIPILFVVSGMGTRFALSFRSGRKYLTERFKRLFIPLLVGIFITVLPQVYWERVSTGAFQGSIIDFLPHFFEGVYPNGNFSWHHLWFLPYLLLMSIAATPLFLAWRKEDNAFMVKLQQLLEKSAWSIYLFLVPLFLTDYFLGQSFPITHALWGDWFALVYYFILFLLGFILIRLGEPFWKSIHQLRWKALCIGVIAFSLLIFCRENDIKVVLLEALITTINMWTWIIVVFGFAAQLLNKESSLVKYRNEAVYPFYIIHQAITIGIGFYLRDATIPILLKFVIMAVGTFGGAWLFFEIVKRIRFLRPLFGLKNP